MKLSLALLSSNFMAVSAFQISSPSFVGRKSSIVRMSNNNIIVDAPMPTPDTEGKSLKDPMGLYSPDSEERKDGRIQTDDEAEVSKSIYDPLGIYPNDSDERQNGQIKASEPDLKVK